MSFQNTPSISTQQPIPTKVFFVNQLLNATNYLKWRAQAETQIAVQGLSKHLKHDSFQKYYEATNIKTERQQRYERLVQTIREKKMTINEEDQAIEELQQRYHDASQWETAEAKGLIQWNLDEEKLIGTLRGIVESHYWTNLKDIKTAKAIWMQLKKETQQDEAGNLMALLNQFFNIKYLDNEPLSFFIARAQSIVDQIVDLGKTIITTEIICYRVLSALPPRFDALQQAIFQLPIAQITLDLLRSRFAAEDSRSGATHLIRNPSNQQRQQPFIGAIVGEDRKCIDCKAALEEDQKEYHKRCKKCQKKVREKSNEKPTQKASNILIL